MERNFFYRDKFDNVHFIKTWGTVSEITIEKETKIKIPYSICRASCKYIVILDPLDYTKGLCCLFRKHLKHKDTEKTECFRCSECKAEENKIYQLTNYRINEDN